MSIETKSRDQLGEHPLQSLVTIDELNLDKECIRLPGDYLKYAHNAVGLKQEADRAKAALDETEAAIAKRIRANPEKYGLDKVTESGVASTILLQVRYKEALKTLMDAKQTADEAQAVVWALEHKKRSLTLLVELHGMGYFSDAKISRRGKEAVEEMTKNNVRRRGRIEED